MPGKAYRAMSRYNRRLRGLERNAVLEMTRRWSELEQRLQGMADLLLAQIAAEGVQTRGQIFRLHRYTELMRLARDEIAQYEVSAGQIIGGMQQRSMDLGFEAAVQTLYGDRYFVPEFPRQAVANMVGLCADGRPLFALLSERALTPDAIVGLTQALIEGVALGYSPRKTARMMMNGMAAGLQKALVIARTEQIRVYREATRASYQQMGVKRFQRHCAMDERTCLACLGLDGTVYRTDQLMASHPQCRCFMVPLLDGEQPEPAYAQQWYSGLDEHAQRKLLGKERFELWKSGRATLKDFSVVRTHKVWGPTVSVRTVASVKEIVASSPQTIQGLFDLAMSRQRKLTDSEIDRIVETVAKSEFSQRDYHVPTFYRGRMFRGTPIGARELSIRYHAFIRSNVDHQWADDIDPNEYLADLRRFVLTGEPKIALYNRRGEDYISLWGKTDMYPGHYGLETLPNSLVVYSVEYGTITTGYQASAFDKISTGEKVVWIR